LPRASAFISKLNRAARIARPRASIVRASLLLASIFLLAHSQTSAQTCVANPGKDGPGGTLGGVVNTYFPGAATANAGATSISLSASNINGAATPVAVGDLLLVMQMQDAAINSNNSSAYGANNASGGGSTALNNTGHYEYVAATSAVGTGGGTVSIRGAGAGGGLLFTYTNAAASGTQGQRRFQVIRVPQYSSATLGSSLTAAPWDGTSGGVLAFDVAGVLGLGGASVNVNGLGFRGGGGRGLAGGTNGTGTDYRNLATRNFHGMKGEGVAGTPRYVYDPVSGTVLDTGVEGYPNGSSGRGAPGNAGGGGTDADPSANDENTGGGGGGGGGDGGAGGNSWNSNSAVGGIGGDTVNGAANLLVMGGGGGAGSRNNSATVASSGASGGGIVMIRAASTSGTGTISANGSDAYNFTDNDGGGGGGAGGSVLVSVNTGSLAGLAVNARGGRGGDAWDTQTGGTFPGNRHGPGGGGGGGFIVTTGGATVNVSGGANGTTTTAADAYGATAGANGQALTITPTQVSGVSSGAQCVPVLTVSKTTSTPVVSNGPSGTTATYSIVVSNAANRNAATSLAISDTLPTSFTYASTGSLTLAGGAARPSTANPTAGDAVPNWSTFTIPGGASVTITFTTNIAAGVSGVQQNPATATYLDPARTTANGTTTASYNPASSTAEDVNVVAPPDVQLVKDCTAPANCTTQQQTPGTDLTYKITFTNSGGRAAQNFVLTDQIPSNTDFKVGSVSTSLGTTGTTVVVAYSNDGGATYAYTPASGGGGAPAGYDRNVTHVRWTFTGNLSQTSPNNTGSVSFTTRIR
jgi:uncharacterized repeat protein (TIGR01451 family)/fimbrial isopeptide formation D2 family protein